MIDLHIHTIYSDGEYTPLQILNMCNEKNISTLAITDHNTFEGAKRAIVDNPYKHITVIPGVEFGVLYDVKGADLHILGYNIDLENKELNAVSNAIIEDNVARLSSLISLLKKYYNLTFKDSDIEKVFNCIGNIGRPDIAKLCVEYGYSKTVSEAFDKYLNPVHDKIEKRKHELTDKECIKYILNAGGIPCLAHPFSLKKDINELKQYISTLISYGLQAIEVYHSNNPYELTKQLTDIVNEYGLLYSVGSDYHGPIVSPNVELGYGQNNNLCKDYASILSKILR